MINATPDQLRKAADILEVIQSLREELKQLVGEDVSIGARLAKKAGKRKMSAAGRAAIAAAAKARWSKYRAMGKKGKKPRKHEMSAQGRARLAAAAKERWAQAKKEGKRRL